LHVWPDDERLAVALKDPSGFRRVIAISRAGSGVHPIYDQAIALDIEQEELPLSPGSVDCIIVGDMMARLREPGDVLHRLAKLLAPSGELLATIPNVQHHAMVSALLRGDWQYGSVVGLDHGHVRQWTYSTAIKLFLDAGLVPEIVQRIDVPALASFVQAAEPLMRYLGLHPGRTAGYLAASHYVMRARARPNEVTEGREEPMSFVTCVSDEAQFRANLLSSPCFKPGNPHELLPFANCANAAEGLNAGLARAQHRIVVCVHQDVYLPCGWPARFLAQWREGEQRFGRIGVAGVYGVAGAGPRARRTGFVVDRERVLAELPPLPARVDSLDELLLALPRRTSVRFDGGLGFHFYGSDICLQVMEQNQSAVVLDALCFHNSRSVGLPPSFFTSALVFASKWQQRLPVATSCVQIQADRSMAQWC